MYIKRVLVLTSISEHHHERFCINLNFENYVIASLFHFYSSNHSKETELFVEKRYVNTLCEGHLQEDFACPAYRDYLHVYNNYYYHTPQLCKIIRDTPLST